MSARTIRLFQRAVHVWLFGYTLSCLPMAEWLWDFPVSPPLPVPGSMGWFMNAFGTWLPAGLAVPAAGVLLLFAAYGVFREQPRWMAFLTWMLFASLVQRAWLASCGGLLLMNNVLLWMVLLRQRTPTKAGEFLSQLAFWMIRAQLLFTYIATGVHKLTGTSWLDGTAVGIVSSDPQFGPHALAAWPMLSAALTLSLLAFQFLFPVAVWWRRSRYLAMALGVAFHLGTAVFIGIPQMGAAFIVCYVIWLDEDVSQRFSALVSSRPVKPIPAAV
jgi:hypothetical protein